MESLSQFTHTWCLPSQPATLFPHVLVTWHRKNAICQLSELEATSLFLTPSLASSWASGNREALRNTLRTHLPALLPPWLPSLLLWSSFFPPGPDGRIPKLASWWNVSSLLIPNTCSKNVHVSENTLPHFPYTLTSCLIILGDFSITYLGQTQCH